MKIILTLLFTILSFQSYAQVKKSYTDFNQYTRAHKCYLDSITEYNLYIKYTEALRKIAPGLPWLEYDRISKSIQYKFFKKTTNNEYVSENELKNFRKKIQKGETVLVNYTIDPGEITAMYITLPPYPLIEPVYEESFIPIITTTPIKTVETDTIGSLMMPNGIRYNANQFVNQYGSKPLRKIFK